MATGYSFGDSCFATEADAAAAWCNAQPGLISCTVSGGVASVDQAGFGTYTRAMVFPACDYAGSVGDQVSAMNLTFGLFLGVMVLIFGYKQIIKFLAYGREER